MKGRRKREYVNLLEGDHSLFWGLLFERDRPIQWLLALTPADVDQLLMVEEGGRTEGSQGRWPNSRHLHFPAPPRRLTNTHGSLSVARSWDSASPLLIANDGDRSTVERYLALGQVFWSKSFHGFDWRPKLQLDVYNVSIISFSLNELWWVRID